MASTIFVKWKSQKNTFPIVFDTASLSVFEIKREIISVSKLGDGTDFDLEIYNEDNKKYEEDTEQIPRSSTVTARRLPPSRPGAGRAARYVSGKLPIQAKNHHRIESSTSTTAAAKPVSNGSGVIGGETEEEKMKAMFGAQDVVWKENQAKNAGKPVHSSFPKSKPHAAASDAPLPPGYRCRLCGVPGHHITKCIRYGADRADKKIIRRATGIPKSMRREVSPPPLAEDGMPDLSKLPDGVMVDEDGKWVIALTDDATMQKFQQQTSAAAEKAKEAGADVEEYRKHGLVCSIDNRAFVEPSKTPCCGTTYCKTCIEDALLDSDLVCPSCGEQCLLDKLEPDAEMDKKLKEYREEKEAKAKEAKEAKSPAATTSTSSPNSKKRGATEELENNRKPTPPAEMPKQTEKTTSKPATPIPTGPKATRAAAQVPQPPMQMGGNMQDFAKLMQSMASSTSGMQGGMPAMMNPMMGMPGMPMMGGMNGMPNAGGMGGFGGMNPMMMNPMMGMPMMGGMGGMPNGGGMGGFGGMNGGMNGGQSPYIRQPVNNRGRQRRQRAADYKEMGGGQ